MDETSALAALSALGQPHRLKTFRVLVQAGRDGLPVGALRERVGVPPATMTAHLNVLRHAGLVADTREGRVIRVRADYARMNALIAYLTENCCAGAGCEADGGSGCSPSPGADR
ncbi:ArsR/SmtB family transcription factor [Vulcaniibacterium thermophilum]|jgi:DNA-binding transcriptional ArsR family regulator|uniref:Transcriptional regulator n=1 Tax=Vulcaniibacterium thermophilum TaxID=1169913 RepID=A0A918YV11_9GAMM|nr:metalloregulator ArsR/SmtB family transcription factor [Vulcaniibacterium thermophilum]GHE25561.1 transcriptional regulator [Vulcaniibacterium thermophilum]